MSKLDLANRSYALDQYADAERSYLEAMLAGEETSDSVVDRWLTCRSFRTAEDARSVVRANPESSAAYRMVVLVLRSEREDREAVRYATSAIAQFGDNAGERVKFVHYRLGAALRGAQVHAVDWQQIRSDLSEVWSAYSRPGTKDQVRGRKRLQEVVVRELLQVVSEPAVEVLRSFASEIERTHPKHARVLRAHVETIALFTRM